MSETRRASPPERTRIDGRHRAGLDPALPSVVWTVGHSSRTMEEFLDLLSSEAIELVADVRRYAGSRAHPHFNPGPLAIALGTVGMGYTPFPGLGGRRAPRKDSRHTVWRNPAFRAYADYMETPEFRSALDRLLELSAGVRTAILCSEAVWWRCHRSMIADAMKVRGIRVLHMMGGRRTVEHPYTSAARIVGGELRYGEARDADDGPAPPTGSP
jgi:uncharacterized protein (DUF488 family)